MEAYEGTPPLWSSCAESLRAYRRFKRSSKGNLAESSWFWEVIDMVYSQVETIPWGRAENAERRRIYRVLGGTY